MGQHHDMQTSSSDGVTTSWITTFAEAIRGRPDYPRSLIRLAEVVAAKKQPLRAFELACDAIALADGDPRVLTAGRRLLRSLLPGYHVGMMNDPRRNEAWDRALRRAIRPGMHVLEIGTGAGMLAMMAARAGADKVITCEMNPVAAQMARELVAQNGYADRVTVITGRSQQLILERDLERPADLLFCDIFADSLLDFDPLPALADARQRLLSPDAPVVPAAGSLFVALANWSDYDRLGHMDAACGFDVSSFAKFVPPSMTLRIGDPALQVLSQPHEAFRFDFAALSHPQAAEREFECRVPATAQANVIVRWIRLELDAETTLEARPETGAVFFSGCVVCPLERPLQLRAGEVVRVGAAYDGTSVLTWLADRA